MPSLEDDHDYGPQIERLRGAPEPSPDALIGDEEAHQIALASLRNASTIRIIQPWHISEARGHLDRNVNPQAALEILGDTAPDVADFPTLHLAQRWHHVRADALLMLRSPNTLAAIEHCRAALELGIRFGQYDPDQEIYTDTIFCTYAEALRRAGQLDTESLEQLRELTAKILSITRPSNEMLELLAHATQTLGLSEQVQARVRIPFKRRPSYTPLSTRFNLPY